MKRRETTSITPLLVWASWTDGAVPPSLAMAGGIFCYSEYALWLASWTLAPVAFAFAVNHLAQMPRWFFRFFSFKPLQLLGIWSYSLYLWQLLFYQAYKLNGSIFYGHSLVLLAVALALALVLFYFLEKTRLAAI